MGMYAVSEHMAPLFFLFAKAAGIILIVLFLKTLEYSERKDEFIRDR